MPYTLIKLLAGGTFTHGISLDWRAQFGAATLCAATPTAAGEILYPGAGTHYGVYAAYAFNAFNPYDLDIAIPEASATYPVQVYMNGQLLAELTSPGPVTCSAIQGTNVLELVREVAPLIAIPSGPFFDPLRKTGKWISLYPSGQDPFGGDQISTSSGQSGIGFGSPI